MASTQFVPALCAWLMLLSVSGLYYAFPGWYLLKKVHFAILIGQGALNFFVIMCFAIATFMDPGVIPKAENEDKDDDFRAPLYKNVEINGITVRMKWCTTCQFYRPPRCSHCSVCNTCIERRDTNLRRIRPSSERRRKAPLQSAQYWRCRVDTSATYPPM
ncbi:PREDICTED: probable palmitoyltransferase ZDHHC8 [Priapulus caudatus]|uniref:Palmitoyltransferase n=1 Tax=Priapulus caudatus TaxID=37621 RepID=A0ABM1ELX4_PRICU|nr:PREDICTED: probable palmitoyltransferase ZDHHC8 [Priapulus caudatus]